MKTLLLLRHAKSSWDAPALDDFDRPLAPRGERDAPRMGRALRERGVLPDLIVCSPAVRARQTCDAFVAAAQLSVEPQLDKAIYGASADELMKLIRGLPAHSACALMVGHNPGMQDLVSRLAGVDEEMPTAALACIVFDAERWDDVEEGRGRLDWLLKPKQLAGEAP